MVVQIASERGIVADAGVVAGCGVAGLEPVDQRTDRQHVADIGDSRQTIGAGRGPGAGRHDRTDMIGVKMREDRIIDAPMIARCGLPNIARDPLAGAKAGIGHGRCQLQRGVRDLDAFGIEVAGIDQDRRAVGRDDEGRIATPGVDVMDIERAGRPGREPVPRHGTRPTGKHRSDERRHEQVA